MEATDGKTAHVHGIVSATLAADGSKKRCSGRNTTLVTTGISGFTSLVHLQTHLTSSML